MSADETGAQSIEIHVTAGPARGRSFVFEKPGHLIFGRAPDAHISVPEDPYISRRHFELIINPPACLLRDLNSANGVFINGVHYGGPSSYQADATTPSPHVKEILLDDGDEIVVRETRMTISIRSTVESRSATQILLRPKDALPDRDIALLLIMLPPTAQASNFQGETLFSSQVGALLTNIKRHPSSQALLFLKYLDKGLMMAFSNMAPAYALAHDFLGLSALQEPVSMALHWGTVRLRRNGDVFGREVYRVYRMAGIRIPEVESDGANGPRRAYLLITPQGLTQLSEAEQRQFRPAGIFELEGFDAPCEIWMLTNAVTA